MPMPMINALVFLVISIVWVVIGAIVLNYLTFEKGYKISELWNCSIFWFLGLFELLSKKNRRLRRELKQASKERLRRENW